MTAMDALNAARAAWQRTNDQLSLEDSAPEAVDGSPTKPSRLVLSPGRLGATPVSPGPSTHPASTDGRPLPPVEAVPFPPGEERGAGLISTATAAEPVRVGAAVAGGDSNER